MTAPRRWLEDPAAPARARELVEALKTAPLPAARREQLFRGLVGRRLSFVPVWVLLLIGAAAAAGSYVALTKPSTLEAETALFSRGVSEREAGQTQEALATFREYSQRYPHGALAAEAAIERIDALVTLGRKSEARDEARRFEKEFPSSRLLEHVDGDAR